MVFPIPDETAELREFVFWLDKRRAITIRAASEEEAREYLTPGETVKVERVTIAGEDGTTDEDKQLLAQLGRRPEWVALRRLAEHRMQHSFERIARAFATKDVRPDYAELQWERGFFAGMKFLLDNPTVEAAKLSRLLAKEATDSA